MTDMAIRCSGLSVRYHNAANVAVNGVDLEIAEGSKTAIVGESGSGKSTLAMALGRLFLQNQVEVYGDIFIFEKNVMQMKPRELRDLRKKTLAYIFQDPGNSLNPVMRIDAQFDEIYKKRSLTMTYRHLDAVRLRNPERVARSYPHQLSGGMQQRVMIAMALAKEARILIADEPTTALDATVQKEILDLLNEITRVKKMTLLLVTHDIWAARQTADNILVMRRGKLIEALKKEDYDRPSTPYAQMLLRAALLEGDTKKPILDLEFEP